MVDFVLSVVNEAVSSKASITSIAKVATIFRSNIVKPKMFAEASRRSSEASVICGRLLLASQVILGDLLSVRNLAEPVAT